MDTSAEFFHTKCLSRWDAKNCPVCYYRRNPTLLKNLVCMKCGSKETLWFCIICGHVGCGRLMQHHDAFEHFVESQHSYVLALEDFKVWDYKKEMWLHQLDDHRLDNINIFTPANTDNKCSCYVCKQNRNPKLLNKPTCMECNESELINLWICLFCSHVGCGRHNNKHALQHYLKTKHNLILQMGDFSIWDYKVGKYQHRHPINCAIKYQGEHIEEEFVKRMDLLERQWQEFTKLTETNKRIITIETRLLNLTDKKKILEEKFHEHDSKLNKLITQFDNNNNCEIYSPKKHIKVEQDETAASVPLKNINSTLNSECFATPESSVLTTGKNIGSNSPTTMSSVNFNETKFVFLIILGLIVYYFLRLCLLNITNMFTNLI